MTTKAIRTRYNTLVTEMTAVEAGIIAKRATGDKKTRELVMTRVLEEAERGGFSVDVQLHDIQSHCPDRPALYALVASLRAIGYGTAVKRTNDSLDNAYDKMTLKYGGDFIRICWGDTPSTPTCEQDRQPTRDK